MATLASGELDLHHVRLCTDIWKSSIRWDMSEVWKAVVNIWILLRMLRIMLSLSSVHGIKHASCVNKTCFRLMGAKGQLRQTKLNYFWCGSGSRWNLDSLTWPFAASRYVGKKLKQEGVSTHDMLPEMHCSDDNKARCFIHCETAWTNGNWSAPHEAPSRAYSIP
jgi:hypothetical protein